jgi:hypothetical protein
MHNDKSQIYPLKKYEGIGKVFEFVYMGKHVLLLILDAIAQELLKSFDGFQ